MEFSATVEYAARAADVLMVVFLVEEPGCCVGGGLFPWDHEIEISPLSSFIKSPRPSSIFASHLEGEAAVEHMGP